LYCACFVPQAFSLHAAFKDQCHEFSLAVVEIAERIRAMGALAPGGLSNLSNVAGIDEIDEDSGAIEMVKHVVTANEKLLADLQTARDSAAK
jgi:starvation-inducible DNA-binding protein